MSASLDLDSQLCTAEAAFDRNEWMVALAGFLRVVRTDPTCSWSRLRLADVLLNLGERDDAKRIYRAVAWDCIRCGEPLLGLVAAKMVLALDPNLEDILIVLAELYSSASDRIDDIPTAEAGFSSRKMSIESFSCGGLEGSTQTERNEEGEGHEEEAEPPPALVAAAVAAGGEAGLISEVPETLPRIPLFSHLEESAFLEVLSSLRLRRFADQEVIIQEGERGQSFFILAHGEVTIGRSTGPDEVLLARLQRGAVFGEMALVSRAPRVATVRAAGAVDVLELSRADLEGHAGHLESVKQALRKFTRSRFLANLAATSPFFASLDRLNCVALMRLFRARRVFPQDVLIEEGKPGPGLYLVLSGKMRVLTNQSRTPLAILRSGDVFGEMSLLRAVPTNATVEVEELGEVLFLPREDFQKVVETYPSVVATLASMSAERLSGRERHAASHISTDDASILV